MFPKYTGKNHFEKTDDGKIWEVFEYEKRVEITPEMIDTKIREIDEQKLRLDETKVALEEKKTEVAGMASAPIVE